MNTRLRRGLSLYGRNGVMPTNWNLLHSWMCIYIHKTTRLLNKKNRLGLISKCLVLILLELSTCVIYIFFEIKAENVMYASIVFSKINQDYHTNRIQYPFFCVQCVKFKCIHFNSEISVPTIFVQFVKTLRNQEEKSGEIIRVLLKVCIFILRDVLLNILMSICTTYT